MELLIASGHPPRDVFDYTPRQIFAFLRLVVKRRKIEIAEQLSVAALGSRGEGKEIEKRIRELNNS